MNEQQKKCEGLKTDIKGMYILKTEGKRVFTNEAIARVLNVSISTVERYITIIKTEE